jgi:hypothetical protein
MASARASHGNHSYQASAGEVREPCWTIDGTSDCGIDCSIECIIDSRAANGAGVRA